MIGGKSKVKEVVDTLKDIKDVLFQILDAVNAQNVAVPDEPEEVVEEVVEEPTIDPLGHLRVMESMEGLTENKDNDKLVDMFSEYGISIVPKTTSWCGAAVRYALLDAGFEDPGEVCHKAANFAKYGEECHDKEPGAILVYHTHVSIRDEAGGEIGGNVSDSVRRTPPGQTWFGPVVTARKPVV